MFRFTGITLEGADCEICNRWDTTDYDGGNRIQAASEIYTGRPFSEDAIPSVGEVSPETAELWDRHTAKRGEGSPPHLYESDSAFNTTVSRGSATGYPLGANAMP